MKLQPPANYAPISMSITDYLNKLKDKIVTAERTKDAERYVDTAVKSLYDYNVHVYIIARFITRMVNDLVLLSK